MTFSDITFRDVNLSDGIQKCPLQPVYIKQVKIFIFPTGQIRVCEIRFASTCVFCGNPYPVCKKRGYQIIALDDRDIQGPVVQN